MTHLRDDGNLEIDHHVTLGVVDLLDSTNAEAVLCETSKIIGQPDLFVDTGTIEMVPKKAVSCITMNNTTVERVR